MKSRAISKDGEPGGIQGPPRKRRQMELSDEQLHEDVDTIQQAGGELAIPLQMADYMVNHLPPWSQLPPLVLLLGVCADTDFKLCSCAASRKVKVTDMAWWMWSHSTAFVCLVQGVITIKSTARQTDPHTSSGAAVTSVCCACAQLISQMS